MPREVLEFRVVIASPSDLFETRRVVFEVIHELNRSLEIQRVAVRGLGWEEYATPGISDSAQTVINEQVLKEYDILVAIFATKLGTPTANALRKLRTPLQIVKARWANIVFRSTFGIE